MNIYYELRGAHYHMRVFFRGAKMGDLCCREGEWDEVRGHFGQYVKWIEEGSEDGK